MPDPWDTDQVEDLTAKNVASRRLEGVRPVVDVAFAGNGRLYAVCRGEITL